MFNRILRVTYQKFFESIIPETIILLLFHVSFVVADSFIPAPEVYQWSIVFLFWATQTHFSPPNRFFFE
jgi:hypothetical protein